MSEKKAESIKVVPYDANWPIMFEAEKAVISAALSDNCIAVHHVGSTSVPTLAAKPTIDIIAVAKDRERAITDLEKAGYTYEGKWNIPLKCGFKKRGAVGVNLHLFFDANHPEIELNLKFRDYLKAHPDVRDAYAAVKAKILEDETSSQRVGKISFPIYTIRKRAFIDNIIRDIGFDRLRVLKCATEDEWNAVKNLRQKTFFDRRKVQDPYHWTFDHPEHEHFVLYCGVEIVGYAHIQLRPEIMDAILRIIVVTEENRNQGFGIQFLTIIEEWLKVHNYKILHVETSGRPMSFYKKRGYTKMLVDDPYLDPSDTPLGKKLM
ncbi:MAG: GNAT family N-acetyltransferase [Holosporales bacterium]|nr:GNAT family N-acetyltransferase [Holosporales bacterium]